MHIINTMGLIDVHFTGEACGIVSTVGLIDIHLRHVELHAYYDVHFTGKACDIIVWDSLTSTSQVGL